MTADTLTTIRLVTFSPAGLDDVVGSNVVEILSKVQPEHDTWIQVVNLHDATVQMKILSHFGLPVSLVEDLESSSTKTFEGVDSESYIFKKFRFIAQGADSGAATRERIESGFLIRKLETDRFEEYSGSIILGARFLLLFQDQYSKVMDSARAEILLKKEKIQRNGVSYLLYLLSRAIIIENYFLAITQLMEDVHDVEDALLEGATDNAVYRDVVRLRREMNPFERSLLHAGAFIGTLRRDKPGVLSQKSIGYFTKNLDADLNRLQTEFSILRDRTSQLMQMYRDNVNTQLNNVMRVLTVISVVFLPLSFITGFYGMNFPNMPAFQWDGSFPVVVATMLSLAIGMLFYARKKNLL